MRVSMGSRTLSILGRNRQPKKAVPASPQLTRRVPACEALTTQVIRPCGAGTLEVPVASWEIFQARGQLRADTSRAIVLRTFPCGRPQSVRSWIDQRTVNASLRAEKSRAWLTSSGGPAAPGTPPSPNMRLRPPEVKVTSACPRSSPRRCAVRPASARPPAPVRSARGSRRALAGSGIEELHLDRREPLFEAGAGELRARVG